MSTRTVPFVSRLRALAAVALLVALAPTSATATPVTYNGITFPDGVSSFADAVVSYEPLFGGGPGPSNPSFTDPTQALGTPNYTGGNDGTGAVSLGDGGRITLRFTDNALIASGDAALDLYVFEIGSQVEDTFVEISVDGVSFLSVGEITGSTGGINIDPFLSAASIPLDTAFYFVRLTDDPTEGGQSGDTVGADIDAVGAIVSVVPEPTLTLALLPATLLISRRR